MKPLVRPLITSAIFMGGIFALALVPALDRRGLPGGLFAVVILLILMLLSVRVVLGEFPPRGRRRMLADAARTRALKFRIRPRIPRSMKTLPSFADGRTFGADAWNLIAFPGEPVVLTFDRRVTWQDSYESATWMASAACRIPFEGPSPDRGAETDRCDRSPRSALDPLDRIGSVRTPLPHPNRRSAFRDGVPRPADAGLDPRTAGRYDIRGRWRMGHGLPPRSRGSGKAR